MFTEAGVGATGVKLRPCSWGSRRLSDLPSPGVVSASVALTANVYAPVALTHLSPHTSLEVTGAVSGLALVGKALAFLLFFAVSVPPHPGRVGAGDRFPTALIGRGVSGPDQGRHRMMEKRMTAQVLLVARKHSVAGSLSAAGV
jgi:hypothetical protein